VGVCVLQHYCSSNKVFAFAGHMVTSESQLNERKIQKKKKKKKKKVTFQFKYASCCNQLSKVYDKELVNVLHITSTCQPLYNAEL